jgi:hypothetical protein
MPFPCETLENGFASAPLPLAAYSASSGTFPPPFGGGTNPSFVPSPQAGGNEASGRGACQTRASAWRTALPVPPYPWPPIRRPAVPSPHLSVGVGQPSRNCFWKPARSGDAPKPPDSQTTSPRAPKAHDRGRDSAVGRTTSTSTCVSLSTASRHRTIHRRLRLPHASDNCRM